LREIFEERTRFSKSPNPLVGKAQCMPVVERGSVCLDVNISRSQEPFLSQNAVVHSLLADLHDFDAVAIGLGIALPGDARPEGVSTTGGTPQSMQTRRVVSEAAAECYLWKVVPHCHADFCSRCRQLTFRESDIRTSAEQVGGGRRRRASSADPAISVSAPGHLRAHWDHAPSKRPADGSSEKLRLPADRWSREWC
jgi:hypothetical protein